MRHEFPEEEGPSWIPDTFRSVVEDGIAMLMGTAGPNGGAEEPPEPIPSADSPERNTDPAPSERPAPPDRPSTAATPEVRSPGVVVRSEEAPSLSPRGTGAPDATVIPKESALDQEGEAMPFAPAPRVIRRSRPSTTFDQLVAGGVDMVSGQRESAPRPVPSVRTRTRTRTDAGTTSPPTTSPPPEPDGLMELDDDYSLDIDEPSVQDAFGTAPPQTDSDITEDLAPLTIPVTVRTRAPGVMVQINGKKLGPSPTHTALSDAEHTVVVGSGPQASTFRLTPMGNPEIWCFDGKPGGGYRQVPCD